MDRGRATETRTAHQLQEPLIRDMRMTGAAPLAMVDSLSTYDKTATIPAVRCIAAVHDVRHAGVRQRRAGVAVAPTPSELDVVFQ